MAQFTRRRFLSHLGYAAAALPLAGLLRPGAARADDAPPLRLILWPMMNGAESQFFWPSAPGAGSAVTEPVRAFGSKLTFLRNLIVAGSDNHYAVRAIYSGAMVPNYDGSDPHVPSLDQVVSSHLASLGARTAVPSLHLGVRPADSYEFYQLYGRSTLFFDSTGPVDYEANPVTAFDRLFGGTTTPPPPPMTTPPPDLLAITEAEIADLSGRLSSMPGEAEKLSQHLASVRALRAEDTMMNTGNPMTMPVACTTGPIASVEALRGRLAGQPRAAYRDEFFSDIFDAQVDVMSRALVCGLTRVATLQAGSADGNVVVPIMGGLPHHNTSHGSQSVFAAVQAWYFGKLARLMRALDVPDPLDASSGRTVLDNSAIVVMAECLPSSHSSDNVPVMIAGGLGGRLRTNLIQDVGGATNRHLLKSISRAFGVPDANTGHFGGDEIRAVRA